MMSDTFIGDHNYYEKRKHIREIIFMMKNLTLETLTLYYPKCPESVVLEPSVKSGQE